MSAYSSKPWLARYAPGVDPEQVRALGVLAALVASIAIAIPMAKNGSVVSPSREHTHSLTVDGRTRTYRLTAAGEELRPVVEALARFGLARLPDDAAGLAHGDPGGGDRICLDATGDDESRVQVACELRGTEHVVNPRRDGERAGGAEPDEAGGELLEPGADEVVLVDEDRRRREQGLLVVGGVDGEAGAAVHEALVHAVRRMPAAMMWALVGRE